MRRLRLTVLTTLAVAVAMGATPLGALAAPAGTGAVSPYVEGTLRVVPVEDGTGYQYAVFVGDTAVPITGDGLAGAVTGDTVMATLEVPAEIAASIPRELADDLAADRAVLDEESAQAVVEESDARFLVTSATVRPAEVAAAVAAHAHYVNVVIAKNTSSPLSITDADVARIVNDLETYWVSQAGGQITAVDIKGTIKRLDFADGECTSDNAWSDGAEAFGRDEQSYSDGSDPYTHLLVLANGCNGVSAGNGLGTIGSGLHSGGTIWAQIDPSEPDRQERQVVAHEFGHNVSLDHSNLLVCTAPGTFDGSGCSVDEYEDYYDVMAGGYTYGLGGGGQIDTEDLTTLNVTSRVKLDVLTTGNGGLRRMALGAGQTTSTTTVTLPAASASSGARGIELLDDRSGETYFLEYRSGTGVDDGAYYEDISGIDSTFGIGVRILRVGAQGDSVALRTTAANDADRKRFLTTGQTQSTDDGGIAVTVNSVSAGSATLTVTLRAFEVGDIDVVRVAGSDRYATAVELSKRAFPTGADVVYVATGGNFPDALSAGPAAAAGNGPVLLTLSGSLPAVVKNEIARLSPARIVVVGGKSTVSDSVLNALKKIQSNTQRIGGTDRYDTGRLVVRDAFDSAAQAFIATGSNFPDALSAGAIAGGRNIPVVLLNGTPGLNWYDAVDAPTTDLLSDLGVESTTIAGGLSAVDENVEFGLYAAGFSPLRYAGSDRFTTSAQLNAAFFTSADTAYLATGSGFADALAGSAVAGGSTSPLYVVGKSCVSRDVLRTIVKLGVDTVVLIGGTAALGSGVAKLTPCA